MDSANLSFSFWHSRADIAVAMSLLVLLLAWRRGAGPERACALVLAGKSLAHRLSYLAVGGLMVLDSADGGLVVIDAMAAVGLVLIALRANRAYPLVLAALQLVIIAAQLLRSLSPAMSGPVHAIIVGVPSALELIVLLIGIAAHQRRLQRFGAYRAWRHNDAALSQITRP